MYTSHLEQWSGFFARFKDQPISTGIALLSAISAVVASALLRGLYFRHHVLRLFADVNLHGYDRTVLRLLHIVPGILIGFVLYACASRPDIQYWAKKFRGMVILPGVGLQEFTTFLHWLYTKEINSKGVVSDSVAQWLINCYILGERLQAQAFQNCIIDLLITFHGSSAPTKEDLSLAFKGTSTASPLGKLLVDFWIFSKEPEYIKTFDLSSISKALVVFASTGSLLRCSIRGIMTSMIPRMRHSNNNHANITTFTLVQTAVTGRQSWKKASSSSIPSLSI